MAIKIQFDDMHTPEAPTLVLSKYSGEKLGVIEATSIELSGKFNDASEIHFTVYKEFCHLWDEIRDFRLCWAKEWDKWFQMKVTITDEEATVKNVECRQLGHAELSQVNLHDLQINTEDDIDRDDYNENEPHTFYNERYLENSILYRVMNKVPHYSIKHVDYSVGSLYGVFTFDGVSVLDAFKQLEEEFDCLIVINSGTNDDGTIERSVSVYDLETLCLECGHRGVFTDVCEDCGSTDIKYGYGDDTTIYIDKENLASSVEFTTDNDSVKNCFRLVAGDDLMTDTIIQTNPNGSQYLWFVTDEMKEDMSTELVAKIADYDASYDYYLNDYVMTLPQELVTEYNGLVAKYLSYNEDLISIESNVIGYEKLMDLEYDVIDFELFLQTSFMPAPELMNTTAEQQAALLNRNTMGTVAVANLDTCSKATASNAVMSVAKAIIDPRYSAKIKTDAYDQATRIWTGVITVQNYSNEDDKMDSASLTITINGDEALFVKQQIFRALDKKIDVTKIDSAYDAKALFALDLSDFKNELKTYGVDSLSAFEQMGQSCLDVMQSYGASIDVDWNRAIYDALYVPYSDKVLAIQEELQLREQEVAVIKRMHDEVVTNKQTIRSALNMESYFGETLWNEFISFCREDDYRNDNYISDGLSNVELFEFARNFVRTAKKELYKSATLQHSISTTLSNLLVMKEFEPIVDYFQLGNWIRVKCDDEIYKLRLISYTINFDNPENIEVEFSDVKSVATGISDIESIIDQASSMSSSYQSIERQASKGDAASKQMTNWFERGLDATLSKIVNNADDQTMVMDDHGLLMREYNPETDEYNNEQLKIINSTIAITDDNWRSTKTAVGKFYYYDFNTGRLKQTFGINGETVVGKLLVGEALGLYNSSATLKFDENGLYITNGTNTFTVNPNSDVLLAIAKGNDSLLSVNDAGNLTVSGDLVANTLATGGRLSSAVGQSGMYIDSDGNVYSGRANEFMVTYEGKLYAKDADIEGTVKATNGTFSGAISSSTYSAGEKIAKDVKKNGLFIDSDGSIYGGPDNQVTIKPDGTFQFGGTNGVIYNGSTLSVTGNITANTLSTGGRPSASTGHNGLFIDSDGNLYSGSNNGVILYNNGQFNLANKITYNGSIVSIAGDVVIGGSDSASQIITNITNAQATADSKTHIFYGSPNDTHSGVSIGDYLIDKSDGCTYKWTGTDWDSLTNYSKAISEAIKDLNTSLTAQLDNKIDTWAQSTDPSSSWTTEDKPKHDKDLWYYTGTSIIQANEVDIEPSKTYQYNATTNKWMSYNNPSVSLFDYVDGKSTIYYGKKADHTTGIEEGDYLVDSSDGCTYRWDDTQKKWVEAINYSKAISEAIKDLNTSLTAQLDNKIDTWAQMANPSDSWTTADDKAKHNGDLWFYTGISNLTVNDVTILPSKTYKYNSTTNKWESIDSPELRSLFDLTDGKSSIRYGTTTGTYANLENGDYLVDSTDGCTYRWDATNNTWVEVTKTGTLYATCDTDTSTANKVAQCNKAIALYEGLVVSVKFTKANTSTSALTLKVGDLAAKNIQVGNSNTSSTNKMLWASGATITFIYNGEKWLFADQPQTYNASCATAANTAAKSSSVSNAVVVNGTTANVTFTYSNTASNATLDITNTSANAASISANGTSLSATSQYNWNAGATASFTFDGTKWLMNNTSALYNTNSYMKFESSGTAQGLMIANMTGGVVGNSSITSRNVLLQSDGLKIRNGQKVLASYGDSIIMYKPGTTTEAVNISSESATFNGIINATSGSFGGFTIDSDSIYSGTKGNSNTNLDITLSTAIFQRTIGGVDRPNLKFAIGANFGVKNDGTIYVGDGIFKGSVTATSLSTGGRTSSSTGTNGTYIDSTGNIYIGSTNATKLYANGNFQFGGSNGITYDGSNVTLGSNVKLSWSSITDPHETQLPDWVNKVSTEITGNTIKTTNLYAADIIGDTIHGKNIYTGNKSGRYSTNTGVYLTSDGYIVAGSYSSTLDSNPFEVSPSGVLRARNVDITGDITARSLTLIGDTKIPYGSISNTPDLDAYIETDDPLGTLPSDTATSSTSTGFNVSSEGLLTASNARIFGTIYATAGKFKGDVTANTLSTGTKSSSSSGTGTYIDSDGAIYSGSNSNNYFYVTKEGKFKLGGDNGIRYVDNSSGRYVYIGNGFSIDLSNGNMAVDNGSHLVFNDGLITHGNIIAYDRYDGSKYVKSTIRATGGLYVGSGSSTDSDDWVIKQNNSEANFGVPISVKTSASGNKVIQLKTDGEISCKKLTSSGDIGCTGTLTCGSFEPSSIASSGEIKSSYNTLRYATMLNTQSIDDESRSVVGTYNGTRYVRMSAGSNSAHLNVYYRDANYVDISGYGGITVVGGKIITPSLELNSGGISGATTISASSTITGGALKSNGNLTLSGTISGATTISASSTITGGSLKSNGGLTLSGAISGATSISASGTVTANEFDGDIVTMAGDTRRPIGSSATNKRFTNVIGTRPGGVLSVEGQFGESGYDSYTYAPSNSDARLKKDISNTLIKGLDIVRNIQHRQFTWKHDGHHDDIGYIAQELECINKGLVYHPETENEYYSINTLFLQAVTTKALQELITEVDTLKSRIAELERTKGEINES